MFSSNHVHKPTYSVTRCRYCFQTIRHLPFGDIVVCCETIECVYLKQHRHCSHHAPPNDDPREFEELVRPLERPLMEVPLPLALSASQMIAAINTRHVTVYLLSAVVQMSHLTSEVFPLGNQLMTSSGCLVTLIGTARNLEGLTG
jgi:hypothetical protein